MILQDGIIDTDSEVGKLLGFTSDKFGKSSYMWKTGNAVWISAIRSIHPGKGDFSRLLKTLDGTGFDIIVPTAFPRMQQILERKGFVFEKIWDAEIEVEVEVWTKRKPRILGANGDCPINLAEKGGVLK